MISGLNIRKYFLLFCLLAGPLLASTVNPKHPVYEFLNRMNIRFQKGWSLQIKPWSQKEIKSALRQLEENSTELSLWERRQYHFYRKTFLPKPKFQHSVLGYQKENREILLRTSYETELNYQDSLPREKLYAFGTLALMAEGKLDSNLAFVSEIYFGQIRSLENQFFEHYQANWGMPYNTPQKASSSDSIFENATFDAYRAVLTYDGNIRLDFGNDWNEWGPGLWQHPSFSAESWFWSQDSTHGYQAWEITELYYNSPLEYTNRETRNGYERVGQNAPIPQLRATINWDFLTYTKFMGKRTGLRYLDDRYVSGHKLQFNYKGLSLGAYEAVVFQRDNWDLTYSIPFISLFVAEHFQGDRDNIALGLDAQYIYAGKYRFWTELFLDDLVSPTQLFEKYWGNKYSVTLGAEVLDPLIKNSRLALEYSRVEPWVYSHITLDNQFQHLGALLGSSLPPNSQSVRLDWQHHLEILNGFSYNINYLFFQQQHDGRGSSIFHQFQAGEPESKNFLGKNPETRHQLSIHPKYNWDRYFSLEGHLGYQYLENWKSNSNQILESLFAGLYWKFSY